MEKYQTLAPRFWALIIDGLLFFPLSFVNLWVHGMNISPAFSFIWNVILSFSFPLYIIVTQGLYGQTLGKKLMKVKVVDISENPISFYQSFLREFPQLLFTLFSLVSMAKSLFLNSEGQSDLSINPGGNILHFSIMFWGLADVITALVNEKRRALHDYLAGTVVIKTNL